MQEGEQRLSTILQAREKFRLIEYKQVKWESRKKQLALTAEYWKHVKDHRPKKDE
jgi:hypothetical protein